MKIKNLPALDDKDNKAVQLLMELGMPKNLAKTLMYISQVDECRSADIEHGANMRQPEVSIAMQELRRKGWITKHNLKGKGKGRPTHIYKPTIQLSDIIKNFEQKKLKELETIEDDLSELRNIVKNI